MIETTKIGMVWKNLKFHHPPSQFGTLATYVQLHASFLEDIPIYPVDPCDNHNVVNHRTKWAMASSTRWHYQRVHVQMAYLAHPGSLHADFFSRRFGPMEQCSKPLFVDDSMGLCYPKEVGTITIHFQKSVLTQCKGTVKELGRRASPCFKKHRSVLSQPLLVEKCDWHLPVAGIYIYFKICTHMHTRTHTHTYIYIYIYIQACICICIYVYV